MAILVCENLNYLYNVGTPFETAAIENVNFSADKSEIIGIIGHTGSGKSTLIQHFNGLLEPTSGKIFVNSNDIWSKENRKQIRNVRFAVGLCFQYPEYQIFEETIFKEIAYGPTQMGLADDEIKKRVYESMDFVGISRELESKSPFDLSGGQKRRVAIASIIAMKPQVLILDEPCAGLDPKGRQVILNLVRDYQRKEGNTVIFVSHSMEDVAAVADRVLVLNKGKIAMDGSVNAVYSRGKELKKIGLNVPEVTDIFLRLHDMGIDCKTDIYTIEQAVNEYNRLLDIKEDLARE
ncbi:MAG TPA: energy-coupling factor transporter ATPase [Ruminococcaceae bacterium]|nr:energy-coupling factor transporter ATPase [Oscillospiraceae bacterium]HCO38383.1 energy-coupling factor transporter ATPase [Oscillospiraceae bacterium]